MLIYRFTPRSSFSGLACRINDVRRVAAEAVGQAVLLILAVIERHEVDNALNDLGSQGIGIALSCFQQNGQRFLVNLCADALELRISGIDTDGASDADAALKAYMKSPRPRSIRKTRPTPYPHREDWREALRWASGLRNIRSEWRTTEFPQLLSYRSTLCRGLADHCRRSCACAPG